MTILLFIIILGALVFVHELGHFLVAKYSGIRVDEFALGFPPRLISRKVGETTYSINLVPFGGYVKIHGEDPVASSVEEVNADPRSFASKNRLIQACVLVGGVAMNFIFAWILFSSIFMAGATVSKEEYSGHTLRDERLMIVGVSPDSPALKGGLKAGDSVVSLESVDEQKTSPTLEEMQAFVSAHKDEEVTIIVSRGKETLPLSVTPRQEASSERATIGVGLDIVGELSLSVIPAFIEGAIKTYQITVLTAVAIGQFIYDAVMLNADLASISGPVGIATLVGDARTLGWFYVVSFTALISINLGVINLIPFPALDGGRLLFVAIEAIIRRPLPAKLVSGAHAIGFLVLILLLVVVSYRDVVRLF